MNRVWLILAMACAMASGCARNRDSEPLRPVSDPRTIPTDPHSRYDQPGHIENRRLSIPETPEQPPPAQPEEAEPEASLPPLIRIGGVVAQVNGTPIYAETVLASVAPVLAMRAREVSEQQFREMAAREIRQGMQRMIGNELRFAAAVQQLDARDRELADHLTMRWRRQKIAEAQGSLELARRRAAENGRDFDEMVAQKHREYLRMVYEEKKLRPRIVVSAAEMRQYYERNLDREFTEPDRARFRLIRINVKQIGDREQAARQINEIRERIVEGQQDFSAVAATTNHDPLLLSSSGEIGWIDRGAFALEAVENAVWETPADEVTPVINSDDAMFLALVEEKKKGRVIPFEEEGVQARIRVRLEAEQYAAMSEQEEARLRRSAAVQTDADMFNVALDMAMQNYHRWRQSRGE